MKIIPLPGYALVQQVKKDFETAGSKENPIILPQGSKDSSFFNRAKLLEIGDSGLPARFIGPDEKIDMSRFMNLGDIVILSPGATQLAVPGKIKNESGQWVEVLLVAIHDIVGKIEGDTAEEVVQSSILTGTSEKMN